MMIMMSGCKWSSRGNHASDFFSSSSMVDTALNQSASSRDLYWSNVCIIQGLEMRRACDRAHCIFIMEPREQ